MGLWTVERTHFKVIMSMNFSRLSRTEIAFLNLVYYRDSQFVVEFTWHDMTHHTKSRTSGCNRVTWMIMLMTMPVGMICSHIPRVLFISVPLSLAINLVVPNLEHNYLCSKIVGTFHTCKNIYTTNDIPLVNDVVRSERAARRAMWKCFYCVRYMCPQRIHY